MRKMKKFIALTMCATMVMVNTLSAAAASYKVFQTDSFKPGVKWTTEDGNSYDIPTSFSKKWVRPVQWEFKTSSGDVYDACLVTVGYDTWGTNEDYMKSVGGVADYYVRGRVKNSKGNYSSYTSWKRSGTSAKVDIKHTGGSVVYQIQIANYN